MSSIEENGHNHRTTEKSLCSKQQNVCETVQSPGVMSQTVLLENVNEWTVQDVARWLHEKNFSEYVELFCDQHRIDGQVLLTLTQLDLRSEPLALTVFGDIKRLCIEIDRLRDISLRCNRQNENSLPKMHHSQSHNHISSHGPKQSVFYKIPNSKQSSSTSRLVELNDDNVLQYEPCQNGLNGNLINRTESPHQSDNDGLSSSSSSSSMSTLTSSDSFESSVNEIDLHNDRRRNDRPYTAFIESRQVHARIVPTVTLNSTQFAHHLEESGHSAAVSTYLNSHSQQVPAKYPEANSNSNVQSRQHHHHHGHHHRSKEFKPEVWKALVSLLYVFASTWVTAIIMVIVHDRVPDMDTYPPLPDIILDNLPLIPWAFQMCELCGVVLMIIWALILVFHKHRFILIRRLFSLFGSVFLIRCVTMLITSLSVPGKHLKCKARPYGSWSERLYQAYIIWQGGGLSLQGVRTCGDYMFSGHTVLLTLLNFFITEYTPTKFYLIHTTSWVLNLFGIFFILAAHEHYSIDVFVAFYISTRLFLYYHTLANNRALYQRDRRRTRIWFPLFYFFESSVTGIVPNEYEIPFISWKDKISSQVAHWINSWSWINYDLTSSEEAARSSSRNENSGSDQNGIQIKLKTQ